MTYKSPKLKKNTFTIEELVRGVQRWDELTMPIYWAYTNKHPRPKRPRG